MSDLLIRCISMPETCKLCYLSKFDPGFYAYVCKPTGIRIDYDMAKIDRPKRICPLVPVPPHFDLIDHNALKIAVMNGDCETRLDFLKHTMDCINHAPVVIPSDMPLFKAEGGE